MTKSFEEFEIHKKSIRLAVKFFQIIESKSLEREFSFKDQLKSAVISISNNIA